MEQIEDFFRRFEQLNDIGVSLSSERELPRLLEKILSAAKQITHADAGTLYLLSEDQRQLCFEIVCNDTLAINIGGTFGPPDPALFPPLPLYRPDGSRNDNMVAAYAALTGVTINIADAYEVEGFDFYGTRQFDAKTGYRSQSFLTVPMRNHESEIIGVLQLINAKDESTGAVQAFSATAQRFAESLASQAAIALSNRQLIAQLEALFEALIKLINLAIDEKSPYTAGHCQRVPELTMMLADAVNATTEGPLADFHLTEKDRHELRIAALMHDCGKITTPVHVVDKATKLETIFDRIELVDTRFDLVRAEALARAWQHVAEGATRETVFADYEQFCCQLEVDRKFIKPLHLGAQSPSDEELANLQRIANSYVLSGKDGVTQAFFSPNELENLSIRAGTLTAAEREVINHHIVATIRMLEQLPWPKHLKHVPEYAGGHHERMDGKGYPKGLKRDEMSWQARMMGIADIFEALTAADRPYKPALQLSEALRIMAQFRDNGHIDPDLYEVFVNQGVFRCYAERFLQGGSIEVVEHCKEMR
ncbi:MAG: GAF domain-containing protein [Rhodocyclales bacterium]|nr:GAF domain-containing protein [Rhodocyclales bacterium]